jgi:hypothetical protein
LRRAISRSKSAFLSGVRTEKRYLLEAEHQSHLVLALASGEVGRAAYDQQRVGVIVDQLLDVREHV